MSADVIVIVGGLFAFRLQKICTRYATCCMNVRFYIVSACSDASIMAQQLTPTPQFNSVGSGIVFKSNISPISQSELRDTSLL